MNITVKRFEYGTAYTISRLYIDDTYYCFVLEDKVREVEGKSVEEWKVQGQTAIPAGTYPVIIDHSPHFDRDLPHVLNVQGFEGIRIHSGNTDKDTAGCLLVGLNWPGGDMVSNSRNAYNVIYPLIQQALNDKQTVTLTIG